MVKILNMSSQTRRFTLEVSGVPIRSVNVIGVTDNARAAQFEIPADRVRSLRVLVTVPHSALAESREVAFTVVELASGEKRSIKTAFVSGASQ